MENREVKIIANEFVLFHPQLRRSGFEFTQHFSFFLIRIRPHPLDIKPFPRDIPQSFVGGRDLPLEVLYGVHVVCG